MACIVDKTRYRAHRRHALHRQPATGPRDNGQPQVVDHIHQRPHKTGKDLRTAGRRAQFEIGGVKLSDHRCLAVVGFDHPLTGNRLFDDPIERTQCRLLFTKTHPRPFGNPAHQHQHHKGQCHQADQGQIRVDPEHHGADPDQAQDAGDQLGGTLGEHHIDILDVIGQPAHQVAVGMGVKKAQRKCLQMGKEIITQITHRALRHTGHHISLDPGQQRVERVDPNHQRANAGQPRQIAGQDIAVDRQSHQVGADHRKPSIERHDNADGDEG